MSAGADTAGACAITRHAVHGTKIPATGAIQAAGRQAKPVVVQSALEHAEHDGADKGKSEIRGHNAQSVDERTKGHFQTSQSHVVTRHTESS